MQQQQQQQQHKEAAAATNAVAVAVAVDVAVNISAGQSQHLRVVPKRRLSLCSVLPTKKKILEYSFTYWGFQFLIEI